MRVEYIILPDRAKNSCSRHLQIKGDLAKIKQLVDSGADVHACDDIGQVRIFSLQTNTKYTH